MALLGRAVRFVKHATGRTMSTAVVTANQETFAQKTWRWLDVTGFYTRWHSRRAWILDLDPPQRAATVMITEYERKLLLWLTWVNLFFTPISLWYWFGQFTHLASKPPLPLMPEMQMMNARKRPFEFMSKNIYLDCSECRWLEFDCKKMCHDRLRAEGKLKSDTWFLRKPRTQTIGFH
mmetsp:Transcript_68952/g.165472  ORF Transcript_68952/g.165472 Transcript_68952/m.165472 type:complete len:178 (-) Transcript_68952:121-654(-)